MRNSIEVDLKTILLKTIENLARAENKALPKDLDFEIERPKREGQGDRATSAALQLAKSFGVSPRDLAVKITAMMQKELAAAGKADLVEKIEVAGPGFINFFLSKNWLYAVLEDVLNEGENYGASNLGQGRRVQVEFVSANPTGPLHIGHGRGAAVGDALANLLAFTGWKVEREYYINDAGLQMEILGRSTQARYFEVLGCPEKAPFPDDGYKGDYIYDLAKTVISQEKERFLSMPLSESLPWFKRFAGDTILGEIKSDLANFGVIFDVWFSESTLYTRNLVPQAMEHLKSRGYAFESDGALWFKSSDFTDEKDRVLIRTNGVPTYFASDIAYHKEKFDRGFDRVIDIWGADHHGYVPRMKAGVEAIGRSPDDLCVLLIQFVNLVRDGVQVPMSTRSGQFVTLHDVVEEVGVDATRYFFLTRRSDSQLDFDLELAKRQSNDNPVYYVQYAHARICSICRELTERGGRMPELTALNPDSVKEVLDGEETRRLLNALAFFPQEIENASLETAPHAITTCAYNLAGCFHSFYNTNRILGEAPDVEGARLLVAEAVRVVLVRCLKLLGVSAPERM
ncbi:MAG: arginine--tRNA ligase [Synergistaceae bacterium]|jgi:arginyl-tRNA synthetase|nr:arginine--tRNA ligase [Synergistaceae bacterium]